MVHRMSLRDQGRHQMDQVDEGVAMHGQTSLPHRHHLPLVLPILPPRFDPQVPAKRRTAANLVSNLIDRPQQIHFQLRQQLRLLRKYTLAA